MKRVVSFLTICFFVFTLLAIAGFPPSVYAEQLLIAEETETESDLWKTEIDDEEINSQANDEGSAEESEESEESSSYDWNVE
jgi:hypothetical protein